MNYLKVDRRTLFKLENKYRYELLHTGIHTLLNHFLNLEFLDPKEKLTAGIKIDFKVNILGISKLKETVNFYNTISKRNFKMDSSKIQNSIYFLKTLIELNKIVSYELKELNNLKEEIINVNLFEKNKYKNTPEVLSFYNETKNIEGIKEIFIQGSLATLDYTRFSDFDTFIILSKEIEENPDFINELIWKLFKSSIYLYKFDPYQHHRYFFTLESNINIYNQAFLPVEVLKYAVSFKNSNYSFNSYDSQLSHLLFITGPINYFIKHINNNFEEIKNLWHLKYYIATIFFLPVLYLETIDIYVYKRESFEIIRKYLTDDLNKFLDYCSEIRKNWNYPLIFKENLFRKMMLNPLHRNSILYEYLMKNYSQKFDKTKFENIFRDIVPYVNFFYEKTLKKLQKRNLL